MEQSATPVGGPADVRVEPLGDHVEVLPGETLIEAAWRSGYYWPTVCGGRAECTSCVTRLLAGGADARSPDQRESGQLERVRRRTGDLGPIRLACCFRPVGDVVVEKKGVRRRLR